MTTRPDAESAQSPAQPKRRRATRATASPKEAPESREPETEAVQDTAASSTAEKPQAAPRKRAPRKPAAATNDPTPKGTAGQRADLQQGDSSTAQQVDSSTAGQAAQQPARRTGTNRGRKAAGTETPAAGTSQTDDIASTGESAASAEAAPEQAAKAGRGTRTKTAEQADVTGARTPSAPDSATAEPAADGKRTTATRRSGKGKAADSTGRREATASASQDDPAGSTAEADDEPGKGRGRATRAAGQDEPVAGEAEAPDTPAAGTQAAEADVDADASSADRPVRAKRQNRPARRPEQEVDVLAAFSAADATPEAPPAAGTADADEAGDVRLPATALLFQSPEPAGPRRRAQAKAGPPPAPTTATAATEQDGPAVPSQPEDTTTTSPEAAGDSGGEDEAAGDSGEDDDGGESQRRRRRRGGRGRRNRGSNREETDGKSMAADSGDDVTSADDAASRDDAGSQPTGGAEPRPADTSDDESGASDDDSSRRRRRRRRSGGGGRSGDDGSATSREGRAAREEITALKGSTRLEAKRQRRRDGRDTGRRRATLTEAEFLARREAVDRAMVVRERDGRTQIAVLEDGVLAEHYVARETQTSMVGNVYLGRVQNVLPSMEAAFIDLGKGRNAILYAGEVNWDAAGMGGQPRRIEQALSSGDSVLVQVTKDPIGHKGARLTSQVTLAGRYLVLVPSGAMTGISRKLPENERARLKKLLKQILPEGAGVIVRTAAEGASEEQLRADVERLTAKWEEIQTKATSAKSAPVLLKGEPELAVRVVRDVFNEDFGSLTVSGDGAWQTISTYVRELSPDLADRMHHWTHSADVFAEYRIDEQLAKALDRKVYLPSGGSLVIDRTEAMTVVDVNTGKFTGSGGTLEETVTKNNLEAAEEIVRQLRLRDIGGIIVIDFIDMVLESNRDLVLRRLVECLGRDRTRHQVAEVTSLGLVQMTRKRVGQGLVEAFSEPCEHCGGRGVIVHDHPVEKDSSGGGGDGGGRRRKQRGGNGGGRQAEPAAATPAEDPQTAAEREAVKATLATIAAAAAQAHGEQPAETSDAASRPGTGQPVAASGGTPADVVEVDGQQAGDDTAVEDVGASLDALAAALPGGLEETPAADAAPGADAAQSPRAADAPQPARAVDAEPAADATPPEPAAEATPPEPAAEATPPEPAADSADHGGEPAKPEGGEPARRSGKRRPRRVTSGGPVTA